MSKLLWEPSEERIQNTNMYRFMTLVNEKFNQDFTEYTALYQWSLDNIEDFWCTAWNFLDIKAFKPFDKTLENLAKMLGTRFFVNSTLNFTQNLLLFRNNKTALIFRGEDSIRRTLSYTELYDQVR